VVKELATGEQGERALPPTGADATGGGRA
jgi:hypothetical protein